ncbi:MAG: hypothetical protein D4R65_07740 [Verrucomicrobiaceae bacterium]|nr:MAG: hypothetical protein D4R65_07740 [Verrucomicrobiaceae bacterium]
MRYLLAILASILLANAGDTAPVAIPVQGGGTATTSKFGDDYITRTSDGQTYTTSKFGEGTPFGGMMSFFVWLGAIG